MIVIALVIILLEQRRNFRRRRFYEDEDIDDIELSDIPEIYMKMIQKIVFKKEEHHENTSCIICLKDF